MGLFSGKTDVYVSSTVYNLAGDIEDRPDLIKGMLLRRTLEGGSVSVGDSLRASIMSGSGTRLRRYFNWAKTNYTLGMPDANIGANVTIDQQTAETNLLPLLSLGSNESLKVRTALIDNAHSSYWAEEWIAQNRLELTDDDWTTTYDQDTDEIIIQILSEPEVRIPAPSTLLYGRDNPTVQFLYISYEIITQNSTTKEITDIAHHMYVYEMGSGVTAFDDLALPETGVTEFFPVVPIRLNNVPVDDPSLDPKFYDEGKVAYRKLTGGKIDDLLAQIEDNPNVGDIDYAFLVHGVSLNTKENAGREYIYRFLESLIPYQTTTFQDVQNFLKLAQERKGFNELHEHWKRTHFQNVHTHPTYGTLPPTYEELSSMIPRGQELKIQPAEIPNYDIVMRWVAIGETVHAGNCRRYDGDQTRELAEKGEYWFHVGTPYTYKILGPPRSEAEIRFVENKTLSRIFLFNQYEKHRYSKLEILGLEHRNRVYGYSSVYTSGADALANTEESEFLIPLHYPVFKEINGMRRQNLASTVSYLVLNSYEIVKIPWYATGFFKFILVGASIGLAIFTGGASLATGSGILGTNLAVGTAIGAGAATAALVGAVVNFVAATIVVTLIQKASIEIFGGELGAILGTIISFVALQIGQNYVETGSFAVDWGQLMQVENLISITNSVSRAYNQWLMGETQDIYGQIEQLSEQYGEEIKKIEELSEEILGMTNGLIDSTMFTDASEYFGESREAFTRRTLLTGSDLADLSHAMIEHFPTMTLKLPLAVPD